MVIIFLYKSVQSITKSISYLKDDELDPPYDPFLITTLMIPPQPEEVFVSADGREYSWQPDSRRRAVQSSTRS